MNSSGYIEQNFFYCVSDDNENLIYDLKKIEKEEITHFYLFFFSPLFEIKKTQRGAIHPIDEMVLHLCPRVTNKIQKWRQTTRVVYTRMYYTQFPRNCNAPRLIHYRREILSCETFYREPPPFSRSLSNVFAHSIPLLECKSVSCK